MFYKEIITDEEANWRLGKTSLEIMKHKLRKKMNIIRQLKKGTTQSRINRLNELLKKMKKDRTYTTKEIYRWMISNTNRRLRQDLTILVSKKLILRVGKSNKAGWVRCKNGRL